jgi:hypothetical protein
LLYQGLQRPAHGLGRVVLASPTQPPQTVAIEPHYRHVARPTSLAAAKNVLYPIGVQLQPLDRHVGDFADREGINAGRVEYVQGIQTAALTPALKPEGALTIETLLSRPDIRGGLEGAVTKLFHLWGQTTKPLSGLNPCADAEAQGLRCYRGKGPWTKLAVLNHPALISLGKSDEQRKYAVLTALSGPTATLEAGGREIITDTQAIQDQWSGDFLVLWKPLDPLRRNLRPGTSGRDVAWLRTRLGEILNNPGSEKNEQDNFFGDGLKKQVIAFQKRQGLKADGIVGTLTRIQLSAVIGSPNAPTLLKQP